MDMIDCIVVEDTVGNLIVTFGDGKDILLQTDYERAAFGVACLRIPAPKEWDGCPSNLPENWWEIEWEDITKCPDYYKQNAE